jgi:hypothetical protein
MSSFEIKKNICFDEITIKQEFESFEIKPTYHFDEITIKPEFLEDVPYHNTTTEFNLNKPRDQLKSIVETCIEKLFDTKTVPFHVKWPLSTTVTQWEYAESEKSLVHCSFEHDSSMLVPSKTHPCANGKKCVAITDDIPGIKPELRVPMRMYLRPDEKDPPPTRTCLLCHRSYMLGIFVNFQIQLAPHLSPPVILQQCFNTIEPGEYLTNVTLSPGTDRYNGLVAPMASYIISKLRWVCDDGKWRIDQSLMKHPTIHQLRASYHVQYQPPKK